MKDKTTRIKTLQATSLTVVSCYYLLANFIIWNVNLPFLKELNTILYFTFIALLVVTLSLNIKQIPWRSVGKENKFLILLILILTFNSFFIPLGGRSQTFIYTIIPVFLLTALVGRLAHASLADVGLKLLLALLSFYMILGVIGAIFSVTSFFGVIPNPLIDNYRYSSILDNPNAFGEYTFVGFFIAAYFFVKNKSLKSRIFYGLIIGLAGSSFLVSSSRAAFVMVIVFVLYLFVSMKYLDKTLKVILITGFSVTTLALILGFVINSEFMINFLRLNQGLTGRDEIWKFLSQGIRENWFFGVGYNNSQAYIANAFPGQTSSAHNMYLGFLYEAGILAFLVLVLYMVSLVIKNLQLIRQSSSVRLTLLVLNGFFIAFFLNQLVEYTFMKISAINTFMFMLIGINQAIIYQAKRTGDLKTRVVHMISGLDNGGAESMLYKVAKYHNQAKYLLTVVSLDTMGYYGEKIRAQGIPVLALQLKSPKVSIKRLPKLIGTLLYADVLQTWLYHANFFGFFLGKILGASKIIWGVRQANVAIDLNPKLAMILARLATPLSYFVSHILSNSDETTNTHRRLGYQRCKFVTIYNGFEILEDRPDAQMRDELKTALVPTADLVILNVARWDIQKDHPTLFQAFQQIKDHFAFKQVKLLLCGLNMVPDNTDLKNLIVENGIQDDCLLLGVRSDIPELMAISDLFILSSLGEGFPNVLGEAMSMGLLVVATDVGDCKAIIGEAGLSVPPKRPDLIAKAAIKLLGMSKEAQDELKELGRRRVRDTYQIQTVTRQYEDLYER